MRLLHQLTTGVRPDDSEENMDADLLQHFYGADGDLIHPHPGTSGAGTMAEDSLYPPVLSANSTHDDESENPEGLSEQEVTTLGFIREQLASQQKNHIRHPPIKVPRHNNPFSSQEQEEMFWQAVQDATDEGYVPQGYGVCPDEWEESIYPEIEVIRSGNRKRGELEIMLPNSVWLPRATQWACALHVMDFCLG